MSPPEHTMALRSQFLSEHPSHVPEDLTFTVMAKLFAHISYIFNITYLYFLREVIAHCPFDALAVYANRGCTFSCI